MQKQPNWYPLDLLPTYLNLSNDQLSVAQNQLQNLISCKDRPHILDDKTINRITQVCNTQNGSISVYIEQCNKWRTQNPNDKQLSIIIDVENNVKQIEAINNQILDLIKNNFKDRTIDSIFQKSDFELGLDFLRGHLDFNK